MIFDSSYQDPKLWSKASGIRLYWPYATTQFILLPDFSNQVNTAEHHAHPFSLPVFKRCPLLAVNYMKNGLQSYRTLIASVAKRYGAYHEVLIAEQMQRMMRSEAAILEFDDLRYRLYCTEDRDKERQMLDRVSEIVREEITRTQFSLKTALRDSLLAVNGYWITSTRGMFFKRNWPNFMRFSRKSFPRTGVAMRFRKLGKYDTKHQCIYSVYQCVTTFGPVEVKQAGIEKGSGMLFKFCHDSCGVIKI